MREFEKKLHILKSRREVAEAAEPKNFFAEPCEITVFSQSSQGLVK